MVEGVALQLVNRIDHLGDTIVVFREDTAVIRPCVHDLAVSLQGPGTEGKVATFSGQVLVEVDARLRVLELTPRSEHSLAGPVRGKFHEDGTRFGCCG